VPIALGTLYGVAAAGSGIAPPSTNTARITGGQLPTPDVEPVITRSSGAGTFPAGRDVYVLQTYTNALGETLPGPANSIVDTQSNDAVVATVAFPIGYAVLGVNIYEDSPVTRIVERSQKHAAHVVTPSGTVSARYVVRATEGFTPTLPGQRRTVAPIYSLMIATAPLSDQFWTQYGFATMPTFADERNLIIYGQRTADNRLAFGGRGAPYHFGSVIEPRFDQHEGVFAALEHTLHELFPDLDAEVTHRWGGPLAMPRDREPSVLVDHQRGLASSTGYTGDGVTLSRVCAEAIADMITTPDVETAATRLPFVQRTSRRWEVEPFRWLGINAGLTLATYADHVENTTGREGWPTRALNRLLG
jgi:hypothetical protein